MKKRHTNGDKLGEKGLVRQPFRAGKEGVHEKRPDWRTARGQKSQLLRVQEREEMGKRK